MDLTEFEKELIKEWRSLRAQESITITKAKEKSAMEGMIEVHKRRAIQRGVDKLLGKQVV